MKPPYILCGTWAVAGLAALLPACDDDSTIPGRDDLERPPLVRDGDNVRIHSWLDLDAWCAGAPDSLDAFAGALSERWNFEPDPFDYYLLEYPLPPEARCGRDGCKYEYDGEAIVLTPHLPHQHEVVHAVGARSRHLPSFIEEGMALYWADPLLIPNSGVDGFDIRDVYEGSWEGFTQFDKQVVAAHFVSYLVRTDEPSFLELLRSSAPSRAEFEREFERVFGVELAAAFEAYESSYDVDSVCTLADLRSSFFECSGPTLGTVGDQDLIVDVDISCADLRTVGPRDHEAPTARVWQDIVFDVADTDGDGQPRVTLVEFEPNPPEDASDVQVRIKRCSMDCTAVAATRHTIVPYPDGNEAGVHVIELPPGRYVARVARNSSSLGPVRFELQ